MKKVLISMFVLLMVISVVSAQEANTYTIEFYQAGNNLVVKHLISFEQEELVEIKLPSDFRGLSVNGDYDLNGEILGVESKEIEISYIAYENIESVKGKYYFVDNPEFSFDVDKVKIKLILDEGFVVEEIFPKESSIETDGKQIWIIWELKNVDKGDDIPIFVVFDNVGGDVNYFVLLLIILGVVFMIYYPKKKEVSVKKRTKKSEKEKIIESHLLESEMKVISELKKVNKREMWQKDLERKTEFSKAKLSRVIHNLEARKLVLKIPYGNTNKIKLR